MLNLYFEGCSILLFLTMALRSHFHEPFAFYRVRRNKETWVCGCLLFAFLNSTSAIGSCAGTQVERPSPLTSHCASCGLLSHLAAGENPVSTVNVQQNSDPKVWNQGATCHRYRTTNSNHAGGCFPWDNVYHCEGEGLSAMKSLSTTGQHYALRPAPSNLPNLLGASL